MQSIHLHHGWEFKQRLSQDSVLAEFSATDGWYPAQVPGTVHQDLLAHGLIPDPFTGLNENQVQWVGETDWLYRCVFDSPGTENAVLCFDGLDTFATVWLNGVRILRTDNMFVPYRVNVSSLLKPTGNQLCIVFESVWQRGKALEAEHGVFTAINGDNSRVHVRKAQYHYGWDWGPKLLTAGVWRDIRLEYYRARIADVHCLVDISDDLQQATVQIRPELHLHDASDQYKLQIALYSPENVLIQTTTVDAASSVNCTFDITNPALWWPRGYGAQALYRVQVSLVGSVKEDEYQTRFGIRKLKLVQEALENEPGKTFLFEVNNTPVFCGGANWIPADSFVPTVSAERYRQWLELAANANMVMLRVWGGGIYEQDIFYDLCDELGLLVWQDFMFACGQYPAYDAFVNNVREEAIATLRRLRNHPSIALWCGNNEDYFVPGWIGKTLNDLPARAIYEKLLPKLCNQLDPTRQYWPGSPYGGDNPNDQTIGDRHTWEIWHGNLAPYQDYPKYGGRFVSEFGMQSTASPEVVESFTTPEDRFPESRVMDHHNKAGQGAQRLAAYLTSNVRTPADMEGYIYATQFIQAEALAAAYRGWRRKWGSAGKYAVAGALVWQLNDCWPVTSWAIADYRLNPKPAYYVTRRELAPVVVGMERTAEQVQLWAVNGTLREIAANLEIQIYTLNGQPVDIQERPVTLPANQSTEFGSITVDREHIVFARLKTANTVIAQTTAWPEPYKYYDFPDPILTVRQREANALGISVQKPVKGLWLSSPEVGWWSDNMLDCMPGQEYVVQFTLRDNVNSTTKHAQWLGAQCN